ncbi:MAG: hypothetical protein ACC707_01375 [Thiohalomonadales bacterium]
MKSVPTLINRQELNEYNRLCERPDVFSRAAIEHSFRLIRRSNPSIALTLQNIMNSAILPKPATLVGDKRTDNFKISLEADEIKTIIAALAAQASMTELKKIQSNITALGNLVILKTTVNDWIELANLYIDTEGSMEPIIQYAANL